MKLNKDKLFKLRLKAFNTDINKKMSLKHERFLSLAVLNKIHKKYLLTAERGRSRWNVADQHHQKSQMETFLGLHGSSASGSRRVFMRDLRQEAKHAAGQRSQHLTPEGLFISHH